MDHDAERRSDTEHWKRTQRDVALPLWEAIRESETLPDVTLDEVNQSVGVAEVNCYEISNRTGDCGVRCVYPVTSLLSHDCAPNCRLAAAPATCSNRCIAAVDIAEGEELSISYLPLNSDTLSRREKLREDWYFECACLRCRDPTELGTKLGGIKCQKCNAGTILSTDPLDAKAAWKCDSCDENYSCDIVAKIVNNLSKEKISLERNDVDGYLKFIDKACR